MNRRDLFRRAGGAAVGLLAALIGIRPKAVPALEPSVVGWDDFPIPASSMCRLELINPGDGPLQFRLNGRFYVDLPGDRYKDTVDVDWAVAQEWEHLYVAECRVRPGPGQPWEKFPMKRVNERPM